MRRPVIVLSRSFFAKLILTLVALGLFAAAPAGAATVKNVVVKPPVAQPTAGVGSATATSIRLTNTGSKPSAAGVLRLYLTRDTKVRGTLVGELKVGKLPNGEPIVTTTAVQRRNGYRAALTEDSEDPVAP